MIKYIIMVGDGKFTLSEMHNGIEYMYEKFGDMSYLKIHDRTVYIYRWIGSADAELLKELPLEQCIITSL